MACSFEERVYVSLKACKLLVPYAGLLPSRFIRQADAVWLIVPSEQFCGQRKCSQMELPG